MENKPIYCDKCKLDIECEECENDCIKESELHRMSKESFNITYNTSRDKIKKDFNEYIDQLPSASYDFRIDITITYRRPYKKITTFAKGLETISEKEQIIKQIWVEKIV